MSEKLYARRDTEDLGNLYFRHVEAMTAEGLHEKNHIAAELAWRDQQIAEIKAAIDNALTSLERSGMDTGMGGPISDLRDWVDNLKD